MTSSSIATLKPIFLKSLLITFVCLAFSWQSALATPRSPEDLDAIRNDLADNPISYGSIPALNQSKYIPMQDANLTMEKEDVVFVVFFPDGPRIYPQKYMVWHEVLNEFIDGKSYCLTYSPISGCLAAYKTDFENVQLLFDTEGRLYNCNNVLIDRNTGSLWIQLLGLAFDGPLAGKGLEYMPVWWSDWEHVYKAYPKAQVLERPRTRKPYGRDPFGSYLTSGNYYDNDRIPFPVKYSDHDKRIPPKNRVIGIEHDNLMMAVDESYVREKKVVNFFFGPTPMLAILDPRLNNVRIFDRTVWDDPILFTNKNGRLVDVETGTIWSYDGKALSGNLQGASMDEFFGIYAFWFAWYAFHPETLLVPGPSIVPDSALVKGPESSFDPRRK